jgi:hypothetical protein
LKSFSLEFPSSSLDEALKADIQKEIIEIPPILGCSNQSIQQRTLDTANVSGFESSTDLPMAEFPDSIKRPTEWNG